MRMVVRCSRYGVHLVGLLAALMAVSACAIAGPVEGPVHVRCLWQLDEEADLDDFGGFWAGVLLEETAEQPELAVVWSLDDLEGFLGSAPTKGCQCTAISRVHSAWGPGKTHDRKHG